TKIASKKLWLEVEHLTITHHSDFGLLLFGFSEAATSISVLTISVNAGRHPNRQIDNKTSKTI
ncbi:MAG TPA: hypothetical protein VF540_10350, partial [Segetibacter sp.]